MRIRQRPPIPFRFGRSCVGLVLLLAVAACGDRDATDSGLSRDAFVEVIVALREAEREVADEDSAVALFAARKAEILERHGTTEEEVLAFVRTSSRDLRALADTWEEISTRLGRPNTPDSLPPGPALPEP